MKDKKIQITARREGFRRCGIAHSAKPTVYEAGHFTKEQLAELKREPHLIVVELSESESADSTELVNELTAKNASLVAENTGLLEKVTELTQQNALLAEQVTGLSADKERLVTENTDLSAKVTELTEQNAPAKKGKQ